MNYEQMYTKFLNYSKKLQRSKTTTAKYRANAYLKVANKFKGINGKVTKKAIQSMDISDHMKLKAAFFLDSYKNSPKGSPKSSPKNSPANSLKGSPKNSPVNSPKSSLNRQKLISELSEFMGLGPEKAKKLISAGISNINQLHMKKYNDLLGEETKLFINLKPIQQIPNQDIKLLEPFFMKAADADLSLKITGSYRREKEYSSDIDLMVISDKVDAIQLVFNKLKTIFNGKIYQYSKGRDKMSFIIDAENAIAENAIESKEIEPNKKIYKIDVFRTSIEDQIPMLLYSTGSKEFNIVMRGKAKKLGYLLNQKGLFKKGEKVDNLTSEKDYFDILGMAYQEPRERF